MRKIINIVAALVIIIGGGTILVPEYTWIGILLIIVGVLILVWELFTYSVGKEWIPAPKITLTKATRKGYEKTQELAAGAFAESSARDTDGDVHAWYAIAFTSSMGAKLYGKKPPSRKLIAIPPEQIRGCSFNNEASVLVRWQETDPLYTELAITRHDFKRCLSEVKKWTVDNV